MDAPIVVANCMKWHRDTKPTSTAGVLPSLRSSPGSTVISAGTYGIRNGRTGNGRSSTAGPTGSWPRNGRPPPPGLAGSRQPSRSPGRVHPGNARSGRRQPRGSTPGSAAAAPPPPSPPPKWKMAVVTLIAVFPPVLFFNVTLIPQLSDVSVILRTFVLCVGVTIVVTWVMMPRLMPLFKGWLHPAGPRRRIGAPSGGADAGGICPRPMDAPVPLAESFPRFRPAEPISARSTRRPRPTTPPPPLKGLSISPTHEPDP